MDVTIFGHGCDFFFKVKHVSLISGLTPLCLHHQDSRSNISRLFASFFPVTVLSLDRGELAGVYFTRLFTYVRISCATEHECVCLRQRINLEKKDLDGRVFKSEIPRIHLAKLQS